MKIVHVLPRKFLWLIPFTLAKKLLISSVGMSNNFSVRVGARNRARRTRRVFAKKFWGEDPLF